MKRTLSGDQSRSALRLSPELQKKEDCTNTRKRKQTQDVGNSQAALEVPLIRRER